MITELCCCSSPLFIPVPHHMLPARSFHLTVHCICAPSVLLRDPKASGLIKGLLISLSSVLYVLPHLLCFHLVLR